MTTNPTTAAHLNIARPYAVIAALDTERHVPTGTILRLDDGNPVEFLRIEPRVTGRKDVVVVRDVAGRSPELYWHADRLGLRIVWPDDDAEPEPADQPGDVLLVGRIRHPDGGALPAPAVAVRGEFGDVRNPDAPLWLLPGIGGLTLYRRSDLQDVTPARVVPAAVLDDIAANAMGIEGAEFDRPSPAETVAHHRIIARRIIDAVEGIDATIGRA